MVGCHQATHDKEETIRREVFLRELVSNASDALEKKRFEAVQEGKDPGELRVTLTPDSDAGTLTIEDNGIGMARDEVEANLGTIAKSGTRAFLERAGEQGTAEARRLIGDFGVGFYSAFLVADEVSVVTRKEGEEPLKWRSRAHGGYTLRRATDEEMSGLERGTRVELKLKEEARNFATKDSVKNALQKYSSFVPHPVMMGEERLNALAALWAKNPDDVTEEEHKEFYRFISGQESGEYAYVCHFSVDAPLRLQGLLYFPKDSPELAMQERKPGVSLYKSGVLVERNSQRVAPEWLRMLQGAVDCEDISLNITREQPQETGPLQQVRQVVAKRAMKVMKEEAAKDNAGYSEWFDRCGTFIKEGICLDGSNRKELADLVRFASTSSEGKKDVSLAAYYERMPEWQQAIYYFVSTSAHAEETSPYIEGPTSKGAEVLLMSQPIDEFVMQHLGSYKGVQLVNVESADIPGKEDIESHDESGSLQGEELEETCRWLKENACKGSVKEVRASKRLVDSPALLVGHEPETVRKWRAAAMQAAGANQGTRKLMEEQADANACLEINPRHPLIKGLASCRHTDPELAQLVAEQLYENARLAAGAVLDTREMVTRFNRILERAVSPGSHTS